MLVWRVTCASCWLCSLISCGAKRSACCRRQKSIEFFSAEGRVVWLQVARCQVRRERFCGPNDADPASLLFRRSKKTRKQRQVGPLVCVLCVGLLVNTLLHSVSGIPCNFVYAVRALGHK